MAWKVCREIVKYRIGQILNETHHFQNKTNKGWSFKPKEWMLAHVLEEMKSIHHVEGVKCSVQNQLCRRYHKSEPPLAPSHCFCLADGASIFLCKPVFYALHVKTMSAVQLSHFIIRFIFLLYAQAFYTIARLNITEK